MEWWEAPELDGALWRGPQRVWWPGRTDYKKPPEEWIGRKFAGYYPLPGEYGAGVKERAVWREYERRRKRREKP